MTPKQKYLLYQIAFIGAILLSTIFSIVLKTISLGIFAGFSISTPLFYIVKHLIEKNAAERAIAFTNRLNELLLDIMKKKIQLSIGNSGGSRLTAIMPIIWTGELTEMII
ncbi:hypothetical protein F8M41_010100 [Gigaspora margarita]|uniref:Uncharacterized protein n=1 Tax=Gigaspora margarita TaxID=4874 RepID=A0A8H4EQI0_GIGMA|nr:hypothetical protein F8M41_010100 [Gigaspora margarita]